MTTTNTPAIRFAGFEDAWEEKKLGEIAARITRKNTNLESNLALTISAQDGLVDQSTYFDRQIASKDVSNYYLIKNGEFAYNKSYSQGYPFGAIKRLDKHAQGVLSTLYIVFKPTNVSPDYLLSYYDTTKWHHEIAKNAAEGARNHGLLNISTQDFFNTELTIPTLLEQTKIGDFFQSLDASIALREQELETLRKSKQGFLQKMFPKAGQSKPELRFAGFTDDWEEKKLGEVSQISTGKLDANAMTEDGQYDFYTSGIKKYKISIPAFDGPAITIAGNGATVGFMHFADGKFNAYQRTYVLTNFLVNRVFIFYEIYKKLPQKINREARTGNIPYIVMDMLSGLQVVLPSIEEQTKIGEFFKQMDEAIALKEQEIESIKQSKKAFLQKMFV